MNPVLMAAVAQLEAQGAQLALGALVLLAKDLAAGKPVLDALKDLAMTAAEQEAAFLDGALKAVGK